MNSNKFLKGFFWAAFASFLAASIPHVAFFFRAYEPMSTGIDGYQYWLVAYAIAISIDVTVFLLSYTVAKMHRQKKAGGLIASVWLIILFLAGLSWYINFKYAEHFVNPGLISPTLASLPFFGKIGDINPLIASCFQILAIAYTWIADKIAADEKPKTASELKAEADELEQRVAAEARIATIKKTRNADKAEGAASTLTGWINAGKAVVKEVTKREQNEGQNEGQDVGKNETKTDDKEPGLLPSLDTEKAIVETDVNPVLSPENSHLPPVSFPTHEGQNETKTEVKTDDLNPVLGQELSQEEEQETGELTALTGYDIVTSWLSTGRKSATFDEVSQVVNLSVKALKRRVSKGSLKTAPTNPRLILLRSVLELLRNEQNGSKNGSIPALKLVEKEEQTA